MSLDNLPALLKNKSFWTALLGVLVIGISAFEPTLATRFNEIVPAVIVIVGFLVGGFTIEQSVQTVTAAKVETARLQAVQKPPTVG